MVIRRPKVPYGGTREKEFFAWPEHKESQNLVKK